MHSSEQFAQMHMQMRLGGHLFLFTTCSSTNQQTMQSCQLQALDAMPACSASEPVENVVSFSDTACGFHHKACSTLYESQL